MNFDELFDSEEKCFEYLWKLRYPEGFVCPRCSGSKYWFTQRMLAMCSSCGYQGSVIADTIFQDTKKPLLSWFRAIWWLVAQKNGVSALGLQRILGLGSYRTAWSWLHKFRRLLVIPGREKLSGKIEVDETYIGGARSGNRGRGAEGKTLVIIGVEEIGRRSGRIRMQRIPNATRKSIEGFIESNIEIGSTIVSDKWRSYRNISNLGYKQEIGQVVQDESGEGVLPKVHLTASLLKRWLLGTHQNFVSPEKLDFYLDEFTFRHNRRNAKTRGLLFQIVLKQSVSHIPVTYLDILNN